jgi:hypothetical protein
MFEGQIAYQDKPRFYKSRPDQWFEEGFFYFEGNFYLYADDRHDFNYSVKLVAQSISDFKTYCADRDIEIPDSFWAEIKG